MMSATFSLHSESESADEINDELLRLVKFDIAEGSEEDKLEISKTYLKMLLGQVVVSETDLAHLPPLKELHFAYETYLEPLIRVLRHSGRHLRALTVSDELIFQLKQLDVEEFLPETDRLVETMKADPDRYLNDLPKDVQLREPVQLKQFYQVLGDLHGLEKFAWSPLYLMCVDLPPYVAYLETDSQTINNVLQQILTSNASLKELDLFYMQEKHGPSPPLFRTFLQQHKLTLKKVTFGQATTLHVRILAEYLSQEDCILQHLAVASHLGKHPPDAASLLELLRCSLKSSTLKTFRVDRCFQSRAKRELLLDFVHTAAGLLHNNNNLEKFDISGSNGASREDVALIAREFVSVLKENNTTLGTFHIYHYFSFNGWNLKDVTLMNDYLTMNRLGRKKILQDGSSMTHDCWVSALVKDTKNLHWLYFVLSANPELCKHDKVHHHSQRQ